MKHYLVLFIILILACGISCKKDSLTADLNGRWVRVDNIGDTITFGYDGQDNWFELFRGYQLGDDGILRPKIPFGIYVYRIEGSSIFMNWSASSSSIWPEYYFSFQGSKIEMGNFIDNKTPRIILEKVK